ncbi:hypothetical protein PsalSR1_04159 (plasmid) [Piscirickettsia salmonis]|nr:hypothetical protein PsalSR1_04159 [Piscirickettsia salmonis]
MITTPYLNLNFSQQCPFLHDSGYKDLNNSAEKKSGYIDMKSLFFENFKQEDRQSIYNTALSLD